MVKISKITSEWVNCSRTTFVAVDADGSILGNVLMDYPKKSEDYPDNKSEEAYLWNLFVRSGIRKTGIATNLIEAAEKEARERGCETIKLWYWYKDSPSWVREWYERRGYQKTGWYGNKGEVMLAKKLKEPQE